MRYDIKLIYDLCKELGLRGRMKSDKEIEIESRDGAILRFQNDERDEDCLVGFDGTPWHTHDDFIFVDSQSHYVEMDYMDVVAGLKDGRILVCELWQTGQLKDRWLIHRDHNNEFDHMDEHDEIRVRRFSVS